MANILKIRAKIRKARSSAVLAIQNIKLRKYSGRWVNVTITSD